MCGPFDAHLFHSYSRCDNKLPSLFLKDSCGNWTVFDGGDRLALTIPW
jgi:hypothetical protein